MINSNTNRLPTPFIILSAVILAGALFRRRRLLRPPALYRPIQRSSGDRPDFLRRATQRQRVSTLGPAGTGVGARPRRGPCPGIDEQLGYGREELPLPSTSSAGGVVSASRRCICLGIGLCPGIDDQLGYGREELLLPSTSSAGGVVSSSRRCICDALATTSLAHSSRIAGPPTASRSIT